MAQKGAQNDPFWAISGTPYFRGSPHLIYGSSGFGPPGAQKGSQNDPKYGPNMTQNGSFWPFLGSILGPLFDHFWANIQTYGNLDLPGGVQKGVPKWAISGTPKSGFHVKNKGFLAIFGQNGHPGGSSPLFFT